MNTKLESNLRTAHREIINMITAYGLKHDINHDLEQNIQDQKSYLNFKVYDPTPNQQTALRKLAHQFDAECTVEGKVPESERIKTVLIEVEFTPASP